MSRSVQNFNTPWETPPKSRSNALPFIIGAPRPFLEDKCFGFAQSLFMPCRQRYINKVFKNPFEAPLRGTIFFQRRTSILKNSNSQNQELPTREFCWTKNTSGSSFPLLSNFPLPAHSTRSSARDMPRGMLSVRIDQHISLGESIA